MAYMTKYIIETFNNFERIYENEIIINKQLKILCKKWIDRHFVDNKVVNYLFINLKEEQLDNIYDDCYSFVQKLKNQGNISKAENIQKLTNYLFLLKSN